MAGATLKAGGRGPYSSGSPVVQLPSWPRLLSIPLTAAYLSRTPEFIEARLRAGEIPFIVQDGSGRVIDRLDLDESISFMASLRLPPCILFSQVPSIH
jgi:hypothetical protein